MRSIRWSWRGSRWGGILLALWALLLRRPPIVLALQRALHLDGVAAAWLGWFGPIGVAALYDLGHAHEQGLTDRRVWAAGTLVIALSTVVHGLTAGPGRVLYRRRTRAR